MTMNWVTNIYVFKVFDILQRSGVKRSGDSVADRYYLSTVRLHRKCTFRSFIMYKQYSIMIDIRCARDNRTGAKVLLPDRCLGIGTVRRRWSRSTRSFSSATWELFGTGRHCRTCRRCWCLGEHIFVQSLLSQCRCPDRRRACKHTRKITRARRSYRVSHKRFAQSRDRHAGTLRVDWTQNIIYFGFSKLENFINTVKCSTRKWLTDSTG